MIIIYPNRFEKYAASTKVVQKAVGDVAGAFKQKVPATGEPGVFMPKRFQEPAPQGPGVGTLNQAPQGPGVGTLNQAPQGPGVGTLNQAPQGPGVGTLNQTPLSEKRRVARGARKRPMPTRRGARGQKEVAPNQGTAVEAANQQNTGTTDPNKELGLWDTTKQWAKDNPLLAGGGAAIGTGSLGYAFLGGDSTPPPPPQPMPMYPQRYQV